LLFLHIVRNNIFLNSSPLSPAAALTPVSTYRELDAEEIRNIANPAKYPKPKAAAKSRSVLPGKPFDQPSSKPERSR
jgi:hypothetical protein